MTEGNMTPTTPAPEAPAPKKKHLVRNVVLGVTGGIVFLGGIAACGGDDADMDAAPAAETTEAVEETTAAETTEAAPVEEVVEEEPVEEEATADGTYANPFPAGTILDAGEATIVVGDVTWKGDKAVAGANQFNDPAPEGMTYAVVPITVENVAADDAITPWVEVTVEYVSTAGQTYTSSDTFAVAPEPAFNDINDLYPGAAGTGNEAIAIPSDDDHAGLWHVTYGWTTDGYVQAK